jgi:CBS domain containing-hemolysin-like protein
VGEPAVSHFLTPVLRYFAVEERLIHVISLSVAFFVTTMLHIIVGELIPKSIAIQRSEDVVRHTAPWMQFFYFLMFPALKVLNSISNLVLRGLGLPPSENAEGKLSIEEIRLIVRASFGNQGLELKKRDIIERVLRGFDRPVRSIMVPRVDMVTLALSDSTEKSLNLARRHGYSRYPISETGEPDRIVGYLYVKDLLVSPARGKDDLATRKRDVLFIPESRSVGKALEDFQRTSIPLAIVVDEYGGTAGLVTQEDAIEAMLGEIKDELDKEPPKISLREDGTVVCDGLTIAHDLSLDGLELGDAVDGDTVGGIIIQKLGRLPHPGDRISLGAYDAVVDDVRGRRVSRVIFMPKGTVSVTPPSSGPAA